MNKQTLNKPSETPSKTKERLIIPLFAGASLTLFAIFFVFSLINLFSNGSSFDPSNLPGMIASLYPIAFSILLLARGIKIKKGWLFGLTTGGLILWGIALYIFLIAYFLVLAPVASGQCQNSSNSSVSGACAEAQASLNALFIYGLVFLIAGLIHELVFGLSIFGKKPLTIVLYISVGLFIIANAILAVFLMKGIGLSHWYYLLPFIGSDTLCFLVSYLSLRIPEEKASPYSEDAYEEPLKK